VKETYSTRVGAEENACNKMDRIDNRGDIRQDHGVLHPSQVSYLLGQGQGSYLPPQSLQLHRPPGSKCYEMYTDKIYIIEKDNYIV